MNDPVTVSDIVEARTVELRAEVERLREALVAIVAEFDNGQGGVDEHDPVVQIALSALHPMEPRTSRGEV